LLQQVGIPQTIGYAREMGVGDLPSVPSLALGSGEVTLQSLTAAYAGFANHGLVPRPLIVRRVEDRTGSVIYQAHNSSNRAISETTAFLMSTMLADVLNAGTAARARQLGFMLPAGGKTGTTNDFNDAWFVGFTPKLVTGVWVGFDQPQTILPHGFAAQIAVPVWAKFMKIATRDDAPEWFTPPPEVTTAKICRISGKLAGDSCDDVDVQAANGRLERRSMVYTEYFVRGTEPTDYCDLHAPRTFLSKVAGFFAGDGEKAVATVAPRLEDTGLQPVTSVRSADSISTAPASGPAAASTTRRGFWSKVFGLHKDEEREKKD
jgi:penicillin-binding protein 1A